MIETAGAGCGAGAGAGVAAATCTVAERVVAPALLLQVSVKVPVAGSELSVWVPEAAFAPVHEPDAEQDVAFVLDQESVLEPRFGTLVGFAENVTPGTEVAGGGVGAGCEGAGCEEGEPRSLKKNTLSSVAFTNISP